MRETAPGDSSSTRAYAGARCGARKRQRGGTCTQGAGWGTHHVGVNACKLHSGRVPSHNLARLSASARADATASAAGLDPADARLLCVPIAAATLEHATGQVRALFGEDTIAGDSLHPWVRVRQEAVETLARLSAMALDTNVEERREARVERYADVLAAVLSPLLAGLRLDDDQQARVPEVVRNALTRLEAR